MDSKQKPSFVSLFNSQPGDNGALIRIMDGCFRFVCKWSAGSSVGPPIFGLSLFHDQDHTDGFVNSYSEIANKGDNALTISFLFNLLSEKFNSQ